MITFTAQTPLQGLNFKLPEQLEASEPAEARGLTRDEVRLLVSNYHTDAVQHRIFHEIDQVLEPGDVVVLNTSATLPAALPVTRADGTELRLHVSTRLPSALWLVELRQPAEVATQPFRKGRAGEILQAPAGGQVCLHTPYQATTQVTPPTHPRLWVASFELPEALYDYLMRYGEPIRYNYVPQSWPLSMYQTVYATEPGSAEMPSAGRAFTPELLTKLLAKGVYIAPLILHTGVASLEEHEPPYEEWFQVPAATADLINLARKRGGRIIAVGTTVIRALETVSLDGWVHPGEGWTHVVITPQRGVHVVDGLLTGFHEPCATHLAMLEALAGKQHIAYTYQQALEHSYLWHEFGDLHLLLP